MSRRSAADGTPSKFRLSPDSPTTTTSSKDRDLRWRTSHHGIARKTEMFVKESRCVENEPNHVCITLATRGNMAKLRHIAIIVPDPEASAQFFERAFDFKR